MEKLLRRREERILPQNAADDGHKMGPHETCHRAAAELGKIVHADDGVAVMAADVVNSRLELDQFVNAGRMLASPVHLADNAAKRVWSINRVARDALERLKHPILIEFAIADIGFGVDAKFRLTGAWCFRGADSGSS